jgi:hypothetical protein
MGSRRVKFVDRLGAENLSACRYKSNGATPRSTAALTSEAPICNVTNMQQSNMQDYQ